MDEVHDINKDNMYQVLLKAIDFFTQRFHIQQIMDYGFEFLNRLIPLHSSALFIRDGQEFTLIKQLGYGISEYNIQSTKKMDELPLFHGSILTKNIPSYFADEAIQIFQVKLVVPLIIETELVGFIVSSGKEKTEITDEELVMIKYLMKLINNSLENNQRFIDFQQINHDLDQQIFNLFVINQSTKALLSELKLEKLYSIATDVFSEVTGSAITSFGIYDSLTNKIKMSGYRNVHSFNTYYTELELITRKFTSNVVLHVKNDKETIQSIIKNCEELIKLEAEYVVFIVKDEILGVVTISKSVTNEPYSRSDFELIESLASTTYIALTNAKLFNKINEQKELVEKKYGELKKLNKLIKTINSAKTKDELLTLTLQTLHLGFGVKKAFFSELQENGEYCIIKSFGIDDVEGLSYQIPDTIKNDVTDDTFYRFESNIISNFFTNKRLLDKFGETNGIVLTPILISEHLDVLEDIIDGYLVVIDTKENLKNEEIIIIDTISKNISPILALMKKNDTILEKSLLN